MKKTLKLALAATIAAFAALPAGAASAATAFPTTLFENSTGAASSLFTGAPDGNSSKVGTAWLGIGGQIVTYDFGASRVANLAGSDFTVYEVNHGAVEFSQIAVSVSLDGTTFTDVTASQTSYVAIVGDELHGNPAFAKSFDLGAMALARYIRIDGNGTGAAGSTNNFDLDAIGAINLAPVPLPAGMPLLLGALAVLTGLQRKSRG